MSVLTLAPIQPGERLYYVVIRGCPPKQVDAYRYFVRTLERREVPADSDLLAVTRLGQIVPVCGHAHVVENCIYSSGPAGDSRLYVVRPTLNPVDVLDLTARFERLARSMLPGVPGQDEMSESQVRAEVFGMVDLFEEYDYHERLRRIARKHNMALAEFHLVFHSWWPERFANPVEAAHYLYVRSEAGESLLTE